MEHWIFVTLPFTVIFVCWLMKNAPEWEIKRDIRRQKSKAAWEDKARYNRRAKYGCDLVEFERQILPFRSYRAKGVSELDTQSIEVGVHIPADTYHIGPNSVVSIVRSSGLSRDTIYHVWKLTKHSFVKVVATHGELVLAAVVHSKAAAPSSVEAPHGLLFEIEASTLQEWVSQTADRERSCKIPLIWDWNRVRIARQAPVYAFPSNEDEESQSERPQKKSSAVRRSRTYRAARASRQSTRNTSGCGDLLAVAAAVAVASSNSNSGTSNDSGNGSDASFG
ncbi:hypothetical protein [Pseudovibrio sp. Ad37]|uniref:hypothetical protein n=1 Tax=Pseudovibrio sp. Ad37 TaxID=989422 RepID=UPI0007AE5AF7|nr:hypothetical protein [Pseudovibrio sp. Ad37]KZL24242.1 hypothetical protein PsAD37_02813 [Pseudovibrio sp. Ad37]